MCANIRPLKERISITIDSDIVAELRTLSENDDRSFSQYINGILKKYVHHVRRHPESGDASDPFLPEQDDSSRHSD